MKQWRDTELLNIHSRLSETGIDTECLMMAETGRASSKPMEDERTIRETFLPLPIHSQTLLFHKACNSKCSSPTCRSCQLPPRTNCSAVCRTLPHIIDGVIPPRTKSNLGESSAQLWPLRCSYDPVHVHDITESLYDDFYSLLFRSYGVNRRTQARPMYKW